MQNLSRSATLFKRGVREFPISTLFTTFYHVVIVKANMSSFSLKTCLVNGLMDHWRREWGWKVVSKVVSSTSVLWTKRKGRKWVETKVLAMLCPDTTYLSHRCEGYEAPQVILPTRHQSRKWIRNQTSYFDVHEKPTYIWTCKG